MPKYTRALRGIGSATRMFHYCKTHSSDQSTVPCINQFVHITNTAPLYTNIINSKNNTTDDGYQVGDVIDKDMENETYDYEFSPNNYQNEFFPDMADFVDENIVGDENRLMASYWGDWGGDIFDGWGFFYLYDVTSGKYYFPKINPQNLEDGVFTSQEFNAFGRTFTIQTGYPVQGIFKFDVTVNDTLPFVFGMYGNLGSDNHTVHENLTYSYSINSTDLTLNYLHNAQEGDEEEQLYVYYIPKLVSQNTESNYDAYYDGDDNSIMSKNVNYGVLVYLSKRYDVKEWVVNDLTIV